MKIAALLLIIFALARPSVFGQGAIKATTRVFADGSTATTIMDPEKRTSEETMRDGAGRLQYRTVYPLNDQNFARGAIHYDAKNGVRYKEVYVFDYAGRITESKLYTKDNAPLGKRVFVYEGEHQARVEDYDANGNLLAPAGGKTVSGKNAQSGGRKSPQR